MIRTWFRNETVADRPLVNAVLAASTLAMTLTAIYWPTFRELEERWRMDPSWSHGYAVVPASLWLMWSIAKRSGSLWRGDVAVSEVVVGVLAVLVGLGLHGTANLYLVRPLSLDAVSFVLTLLGLLWIVGGRVGARTFGGAVLFLVFMIPLPFSWQQPLAEHLQHLVSITSEALLSLFGVPVHREGYLLRLPGQTVEVAEGCSGLRQITLFLAMSVFLGLLNRRRGVWLPLLVLSIPVAVIANTLRITMTGLIVAYAGSEWASGVLHELEGLFTFALGLGMLWFAAGQLRRRFDVPASDCEAGSSGCSWCCRAESQRMRLSKIGFLNGEVSPRSAWLGLWLSFRRNWGSGLASTRPWLGPSSCMAKSICIAFIVIVSAVRR